MSGDPRLTRRALLLATVAAPLAGCRPKRRHRSASAPLEDPDRAALLDALDVEQRLVDLATQSGPTADTRFDLGEHQQHLLALRQLVGRAATVSPASLPPTTKKRRAAFEHTLAASVPHLQSLAVAATGGSTAALLASIAANHGTPRPFVWTGGHWLQAGS